MTPNVKTDTTRNRMIRLLSCIRDLKLSATRKRVAYRVCYNELSRKVLDDLLNDELMQNAVVLVVHRRKNRRAGRSLKGRRKRVHRQFRPGRPALLFKLTRMGRVLLRRLEKQAADERALVAQAREESRLKHAQAAQVRAEVKAKREAIAAQRAIREAARQAAIATTGAARRATIPVAEPWTPPIAPRTPQAPPRPVQRPLPAGFNAPPPQPWGPATARPTVPIGSWISSLIDRIKAARFRVNDRNEVFFDNRWIPVDEWMRRNGSVLDP